MNLQRLKFLALFVLFLGCFSISKSFAQAPTQVAISLGNPVVTCSGAGVPTSLCIDIQLAGVDNTPWGLGINNVYVNFDPTVLQITTFADAPFIHSGPPMTPSDPGLNIAGFLNSYTQDNAILDNASGIIYTGLVYEGAAGGGLQITTTPTTMSTICFDILDASKLNDPTTLFLDDPANTLQVILHNTGSANSPDIPSTPDGVSISPPPSFSCPGSSCPTAAEVGTFTGSNLCSTVLGGSISPTVTISGANAASGLHAWSVTPNTGVTITGGSTANPTITFPANTTCSPIAYTVTDNVTCSGSTVVARSADYTVYPAPQAPTVTLATQGATCTYTLTPACATDIVSPAAVSTTTAGTAASNQTFAVSNGGCSATDFSVSIPACPNTAPTCPTDATLTSGTTSLCGTTTNTISPTVTLVGTGTVTYSWSISPNAGVTSSGTTTATPSATLPINNTCNSIDYIVTATVKCTGIADIVKTATYTVYPALKAPAVALSSQGATCTYTLTPACASDVVTPATVSDKNAGDAASTITFTVTNNGGACSQTFDVSVAACPAIVTCTPPAAPTISATATEVCTTGTGNPQSVTLSTNPTAPLGFGYLWSNGATTATLSVTAATVGTFTVKFVKTGDATCTSTDSAPLTVTATDCGASCPSIPAPTIANTSCVTPDGSLVSLSPNGGTAPYYISLDNGVTTGPADDLDTLLNANASIVLVDAAGCKSDPVDFTLGPVEINAGTSTLASVSVCDTVPNTDILVTNTGATPGVEVDFILTSADNADIIVGVSTDGTFDFSTGYPFGGGGAYPLGNYCFTAFAYRQSELDVITNNPIIKGLLGLQGGESLADVLDAVNGNPSLDSVTISGVKSVLGLASSFVGFTPCVHNEATGHCFELKECIPGGGCPTINAPDIATASCVTPDGSLVALSPNGGNAPYSISLDNGVTLGPSGDLDTLLNANASIILVDASGCKSAAVTFTLGPVEMNAGTSTVSITELCDTATTQVFVTNSGATPGVQVDFIITQPDAGDIIVGVSTDGTFDFTTGYPFGGGGAYPITQYCVTAFAYRQSELDAITNNLVIRGLLPTLQGGETLEEVLAAVNGNAAFDSVTITGVKGVLGIASNFVGFTPCVHSETTGHCFTLKTCTSTPVCNPTTPTAMSDVVEVCMAGTGSPTTATITAATAPAGFGYLWSNGATTVSIMVGAGSYSVKYVKTDDITCQSVSSTSITITEKDCTQTPVCTPPAAPMITAGLLEVCMAGTGTPTTSTLNADAAPSGFGYMWSTGATTQTITVGAGSYTVKYVKVGDATCESTSSSSTVITEKDCTPPPTCNPTTPAISTTGAEVCMAGTGTPTTVTITAIAAPTGFGYLWSNGATTASIDATAGSYTVKYVKIGDATCQSVNSNSITINEVDCTPPDPCAGVTISGTASYDCTAGLSLTGSGGAAPYTFTATKSGGSAQSVANGSILTNGTYTITVKDKNNCSATLSATLAVDCTTNPCEGVNIVVSASHTCQGGLTLSATGGNGTYTYFVDGFQVSNGMVLGNGTYTVDAVSGGCSGSSTNPLVVNCVVDPCAGLTISGTATYNCANGLAISGNGGSAPYSYSINGQAVANGSLLQPGTYTVTVKDKNNCTGTIAGLQVANCNPCAGVTISGTATYNCETGLSLSAQGGTAPYMYMANGNNLGNGIFLANGTYNISISDANGCAAAGNVSVTVNCQTECDNTATLQTTQVELCDNSGEGNTSINLNTLVTGTQGGTWSVLGCSNCLNGSMFNAAGVTTGNYTATYTVTGTAPCPNVSASLIVKVKDCNKPPIANPDNIVVPLGSNSITIDVTQNDSDPEGSMLTVTDVQPLSAGQGTVTISATGDLEFTPGPDVVGGGEVTITYTISDGTNSSSTTLTITISNCLANAGNLTASPYNCYEDGIKAKATGYKMGFVQTYILTDNNGVVLDYASNGILDPGTSGEYSVYALNYDGTLPINLPSVGQNISGLDGECFDLAGPKTARLLDTIVISHTAYCKPGYSGYYFVCIQVEGGFPDFANAGSYHFNFPPAYIPFIDSLDQGQICDVGPIPNGAKLTIDIKNDGYLCTGGPYTISGPDECACDPMPGAMNTDDVLYVCSGDDATATHTLDPIVGDNEVLIYALHTSASDAVGTIIDVNLSSPTFGPLATLSPLGVEANTVYYISSIVGADADGDGLPDFDECTKVAPGTPVVFLNPLMVEHTPICNQPEEGQYVIQVGATGGYAEFAGTDYYIDGVDFNNLNFGGNIILGPRTSGEGYNFNVYDREDQATACPAINASVDAVPCKNTPIELLSFTGEVLPNGNLLKWVTASEIDNDYFTVMRSTNGVNFEKIGEIVDGAGNSTTAIAYNLLDKDAPAGLSYYRLDQTDFNGTVTQSNVITLERGETNISIMQVLPIPALESLTVAYNAAIKGSVEVQVYDVFGKLVATQKTDAKVGLNTLKLNVAQYAAGVYFVSLNNGVNTTTTKFVKK